MPEYLRHLVSSHSDWEQLKKERLNPDAPGQDSFEIRLDWQILIESAPGQPISLWAFVHHFCETMQRLDSIHPVTTGVHTAENLSVIGKAVEVLSFHDYSPTCQSIRNHLKKGLGFSHEFNKPVFLSEIACLARANPYDVAIQTCQEFGLGWYVWELMVGRSRWNDIHGIFYPDGSVRDPAIVAAVQGFFRIRGEGRVPPHLDKEGQVSRILAQSKSWLNRNRDDVAVDYAAGLEILEVMLNLIETCELAPMVDFPSQRVLELSERHNGHDLKLEMKSWARLLRKYAGRK